MRASKKCLSHGINAKVTESKKAYISRVYGPYVFFGTDVHVRTYPSVHFVLKNSHDSVKIGSVINVHACNYVDLCPHIYLAWENAFRSISISVPLILSEINVSIGLFALLLFHFPMFYCKRQTSC